jgi:hypothetical protein
MVSYSLNMNTMISNFLNKADFIACITTISTMINKRALLNMTCCRDCIDSMELCNKSNAIDVNFAGGRGLGKVTAALASTL